MELNNHIIFQKPYFLSDHALLTVNIIIKEFIQNKRWSIVKNSEEEAKYIDELIQDLKNMNTSNICDKNSLKQIV